MKKLFLVFLLLCSTSELFAAFDIKLGVFQDIKNLHKNIAKVKPYVFRKQIIVKNRKGFYYTYAIVLGSRSQANKALKAYRTIFHDAFIAGQTKERPKIKKKLRKKTTIKKKTHIKTVEKIKPMVKIIPEVVVVANIDDNKTDDNILQVIVPIKNDINSTIKPMDAKVLLSGKTIYMCYEDGPAHLEKRIVQMTFNEKNIDYSPLENTKRLKIRYTIEKNMLKLYLADISMVHKVMENKDHYLAVESYVGSKKMHHLRYYYTFKDAIGYLKKK